MTAQQQEPRILKAIKKTSPYHAEALVDGWLCIKYFDHGEESISTFADVSKGDIILCGNATRPLTQNAALDELDKKIVIKIERMEKVISQKDTQLRQGILMAYREVWGDIAALRSKGDEQR